MANDQSYESSQGAQFISSISAKLRDLEEKQRMIKDRLLLIGQNLVETKEKTSADIIEIKKALALMQSNMERIVSFVEGASAELSKFARKEDLDILAKQARMFQPLEILDKKGLKKS